MARFCRMHSAAATLAASTLVACSLGNSYDNPNRTPEPYRQRISTWTVQDVASSQVLASGCEQDLPATVPSVQAAPGQRLVLEVREWVVEKREPGSTSAWWCSDEQLVAKAMVDWVDNHSCFDFPSSHGVRMLSWEPLLLPHPSEPGLPRLMSGTGYRMQLEVEGPGSLMFVPNGTCELAGHVALEVRSPAP